MAKRLICKIWIVVWGESGKVKLAPSTYKTLPRWNEEFANSKNPFEIICKYLAKYWWWYRENRWKWWGWWNFLKISLKIEFWLANFKNSFVIICKLLVVILKKSNDMRGGPTSQTYLCIWILKAEIKFKYKMVLNYLSGEKQLGFLKKKLC